MFLFFPFQVEQDTSFSFDEEEVEDYLTIGDDHHQDYSINNEYDFQESRMQTDDDDNLDFNPGFDVSDGKIKKNY